jgi:hypothetical protein
MRGGQRRRTRECAKRGRVAARFNAAVANAARDDAFSGFDAPATANRAQRGTIRSRDDRARARGIDAVSPTLARHERRPGMNRSLLALLWACLLAGCSTAFPTAPDAPPQGDGLDAQAIFDRSLAAHGGDLRKHPGDINLSTDGRWYRLIQRIQPVVTDSAFRIRSEERYRPSTGLYAVHHTGPGGSKHVVRDRDGLTVHYNGAPNTDDAKLRATDMTNDAFAMFHFGPSWFVGRTAALQRLPDAREGGRAYHRLLATLRPGFGRAADDRAVLWIDARDFRLWRIHQTLNGFETTQGAHVDTTFLEYRRVGPYLFPVRFLERVRGPLRIKAHAWYVTGLDLDRGWTDADVRDPQGFRGKAAAPAQALQANTP